MPPEFVIAVIATSDIESIFLKNIFNTFFRMLQYISYDILK